MSDAPVITPSASLESRWGVGAQALLIAAAGLAVLLASWSAPFTTFDDPMHISRNEALFTDNPLEFFKPQQIETYFPLTKLSYWLDRWLFLDLLHLSNWATGVRFMTYVYHVAAALLVWRITLLLGLSRLQALFVALCFSAHPLACETVCWASERKNALAGVFGFAAVWSWLRWSHTAWRALPATAFYLAACLGKPSALGIFPVLAVCELLGGRAAIAGGILRRRSFAEWLKGLALLAPALAVTVVVLRLNLAGHIATIIEPPGGSVFTAVLTDLEIVSRYLMNLFAPAALSAVYFVSPITSLADTRVWAYLLVLGVAAGTTVYYSQNRRRTMFAWLWFFGALGPVLNLVAIPHFMQDRYLYLSTPAFFILVTDFFQGIFARSDPLLRRTLPLAGGAYVLALVLLAHGRSAVFESTFTIFRDAAAKQPQAAFARWGLGMAHLQAADMLEKSDKRLADENRRQALQHWRDALDCPDIPRFATGAIMARQLGETANAAGDLAAADKYWTFAADAPLGQWDARAESMAYLSSLRLLQGRPEEAYRRAAQAVKLTDNESLRLVRARAALAFAKTKAQAGDAAETARLLEQAREDLSKVPEGSEISKEARELERDPMLRGR